MGALITSEDSLAEVFAFSHKTIGAVPSPFDCFLAMRGIRTLVVRMQAHCDNARQIAEFLSQHKAVDKVFYPGL